MSLVVIKNHDWWQECVFVCWRRVLRVSSCSKQSRCHYLTVFHVSVLNWSRKKVSVGWHNVALVSETSQTAILSDRCRNSEGSCQSGPSCAVHYPSGCTSDTVWWLSSLKRKKKIQFNCKTKLTPCSKRLWSFAKRLEGASVKYIMNNFSYRKCLSSQRQLVL